MTTTTLRVFGTENILFNHASPFLFFLSFSFLFPFLFHNFFHTLLIDANNVNKLCPAANVPCRKTVSGNDQRRITKIRVNAIIIIMSMFNAFS